MTAFCVIMARESDRPVQAEMGTQVQREASVSAPAWPILRKALRVARYDQEFVKRSGAGQDSTRSTVAVESLRPCSKALP
jgi:hypothetical protein